jgi:hypothetical protein
LRFRFFSSEGFSKRWFFFTSDKMPDFSQVLVNLRRAFSKDSPGRTITPVMDSRIHLFSVPKDNANTAKGPFGNVSSGHIDVNEFGGEKYKITQQPHSI